MTTELKPTGWMSPNWEEMLQAGEMPILFGTKEQLANLDWCQAPVTVLEHSRWLEVVALLNRASDYCCEIESNLGDELIEDIRLLKVALGLQEPNDDDLAAITEKEGKGVFANAMRRQGIDPATAETNDAEVTAISGKRFEDDVAKESPDDAGK